LVYDCRGRRRTNHITRCSSDPLSPVGAELYPVGTEEVQLLDKAAREEIGAELLHREGLARHGAAAGHLDLLRDAGAAVAVAERGDHRVLKRGERQRGDRRA
jgi:hypothetical protein